MFLAAALFGITVLLAWPQAPAASGRVLRPVETLWPLVEAGRAGSVQNVVHLAGTLRLGDDISFVRDEVDRFGVYISEPRLVGEFDAIAADFRVADASPRVEVEARSSPDFDRWSEWVLLVSGQPAGVPPGRVFQYRVTLKAELGTEAGELRDLRFDLLSSDRPTAMVAAKGNNPTARVFATREGLVGRKTANGRTILERDRFVALPSKRVLNPLDKTDYQVRVSYRGKSMTLPVWDVGPWNTKDNYWDERRESWADLPRFVPQAYAAWKDEHNGGRDQFGRWVTIPASIDIADGAFIEDLGMRTSDWVDVTFLWVEADSPPRLDYPPVLALKPEPKPSGPPPEGQVVYFAQGNTAAPFQTWLLLQNPHAEPAKAAITWMLPDGSTRLSEVTVEANSRTSVFANALIPDAEFAARVDATRPLFAERAMYFRRDGHASLGASALSTTWFLAEGSSQHPFETWLLLQNPGSAPASVNLEFMTDSGERIVKEARLEPTSRRSIFANDLVPDRTFAMKISSDQPIVVERTVYLASGGGHGALASPRLSKRWYFAEGSTEVGRDTWLLLGNPGRASANVKVRYLREDGGVHEQKLEVAPTSRLAVRAREQLADARFGLVVESDQPIVAERAMYFGGGPDGEGTGAHATVGVPELAQTWYLPEGSTQSPFQTEVLVANPNAKATKVRASIAKRNGETLQREYELGPNARLTINLNTEAPDTSLSTTVTADEPVVVERSMYFNGTSGGTNTVGIAR